MWRRAQQHDAIKDDQRVRSALRDVLIGPQVELALDIEVITAVEQPATLFSERFPRGQIEPDSFMLHRASGRAPAARTGQRERSNCLIADVVKQRLAAERPREVDAVEVRCVARGRRRGYGRRTACRPGLGSCSRCAQALQQCERSRPQRRAFARRTANGLAGLRTPVVP